VGTDYSKACQIKCRPAPGNSWCCWWRRWRIDL